MSVVNIYCDRFPYGSLPIYEGFEHPIFITHSDGTISQILEPFRRVTLGMFEISGPENDVKVKFQKLITDIVLTANFAGRVTIAIQSETMMFSDNGPIWEYRVGMMYGMDSEFESESESDFKIINWIGSIHCKPDGFPMIEAAADNLIEGVAVFEVMYS